MGWMADIVLIIQLEYHGVLLLTQLASLPYHGTMGCELCMFLEHFNFACE
jgi:hypothetical protein